MPKRETNVPVDQHDADRTASLDVEVKWIGDPAGIVTVKYRRVKVSPDERLLIFERRDESVQALVTVLVEGYPYGRLHGLPACPYGAHFAIDLTNEFDEFDFGGPSYEEEAYA